MLTPESKKKLSATIRHLREVLRKDLREEAERVYRLSVDPVAAKLDEAPRTRRARLDQWLDERVRAAGVKLAREREAARSRFFDEAVELVAATFLNRLVVVRCMEAMKLVNPPVLSGGLNSKAARELRENAPELFAEENAGYTWLLGQLFDELSVDLPGLFGEVGLSGLLPVPAATLREVVDALDDKGLDGAWDDDTTLGWVYQYWNDPQREALDAKINDGGKIEGHEIAAKTQMFTERYMVEWLLQNSLGLQWLAMCRKNRWTADAEARVATGAAEGEGHATESVLDRLEARRVEWRAKRERGEVALDALMPYTRDDLEERWRYYVPQEIPDGLVEAVPASLRELKVLDPACGSGHFLVIAFGLLAHLYEEEARHRGATWSRADIARWILEDNLHGIDLDPRAVQIAAAALSIAARQYTRSIVAPRRLNLVATAFDLARLGSDDPAVIALRESLAKEAGVSAEATAKIIQMLAGIDTFGSLVKLDKALDEAVAEAEKERRAHVQGELFATESASKVTKPRDESPRALVDRIERFLGEHTRADDLGVRFDGEQLAAGVRFARMVREGQYHLVVGNPPYQGTARMADAAYIAKNYPMGKADLYAAFLQRGLELVNTSGLNALVTMRGWMFLGQYEALREWVLKSNDLRTLADLDSGAFEDVSAAQVVLSVDCSVIRRTKAEGVSLALRPTPTTDRTSAGMANRKRSGLLVQDGRYEFLSRNFDVIEGRPLVYWWSKEFLARYDRAPKLGIAYRSGKGVCTSDDPRFTRSWWEPTSHRLSYRRSNDGANSLRQNRWVPTVMGADGAAWFEPLRSIICWETNGLEIKLLNDARYSSFSKNVRNESLYFRCGVAFSMIGASFTARLHRYLSVFGNMGSSVFPEPEALARVTLLMNSSLSREVMTSLNPGVHFEIGDVNRLPLFPVECADQIFATIDRAFSEHEAAREASVEFRKPGPSPWTYAQAWAQCAVDRAADEPLPAYAPEYEAPAPESHVSFALGVALGRFGANGEGILDDAPTTALPAGILFLSGAREHDSLRQPACAMLHAAWAEHGPTIAKGTDLRTWLRRDFFDHHRALYENRPIWWPLSSAKRTFVAWVAIHRWQKDTLKTLLVDHLGSERRTLEGELNDLRTARTTGDKDARTRAERRFAEVQKQLDELAAFIEAVTQCAERGPLPTDEKCPKREVDAPYTMDLDDGVMVNSSALWALLEPQWKDPRKWWKELATAEGRKDYDWSHLAARYFPARVDAKCRKDPSLAVAHGRFWRYHPARAFAWELRLGAEIRADFTIDESDSDACRARFFEEETDAAVEAVAKELTRRNRKRKGDDEEDEAPTREAPRTLRIARGRLWELAPEKMFKLELEWREKLGDEFMIEEPEHERSYREWVGKVPKLALPHIKNVILQRLEELDPRARFRGHPRDGLVPRVTLARMGLWELAPALVYAFELRRREDSDTNFVLVEPGSEEARARFEAEQPEEAARLREAHAARLLDERVKAGLPRNSEAQAELALSSGSTTVKAPRKPRAPKGTRETGTRGKKTDTAPEE